VVGRISYMLSHIPGIIGDQIANICVQQEIVVIYIRVDHGWYWRIDIVAMLLFCGCFGRFLRKKRQKSSRCAYRPVYVAWNELASHIFSHDIAGDIADGNFNVHGTCSNLTRCFRAFSI